jgi:hypothetical protein
MTSALVTTIAGSASNSYLTRAEADVYFTDRLHSDTWSDADALDKDRALLWAAKILDTRVSWAGTIVNYLQALSWPRHGVVSINTSQYYSPEEIPKFIQYAQAELALSLLLSDRTLDSDTAGIASLSVTGAVSLTFDKTTTAPVLPQAVRDLIAPYGTFDNGSKMKVLPVARS